jgi:Hemerythrin HHE cation binding domain.
MHGSLHKFFIDDHRRLEDILNRATMKPDEYEMIAYSQFRAGLLKHIKMEESILFPAVQKARGGVPLPIVAKLRLDHGAFTALLVPPPSPKNNCCS